MAHLEGGMCETESTSRGTPESVPSVSSSKDTGGHCLSRRFARAVLGERDIRGCSFRGKGKENKRGGRMKKGTVGDRR